MMQCFKARSLVLTNTWFVIPSPPILGLFIQVHTNYLLYGQNVILGKDDSSWNSRNLCEKLASGVKKINNKLTSDDPKKQGTYTHGERKNQKRSCGYNWVWCVCDFNLCILNKSSHTFIVFLSPGKWYRNFFTFTNGDVLELLNAMNSLGIEDAWERFYTITTSRGPSTVTKYSLYEKVKQVLCRVNLRKTHKIRRSVTQTYSQTPTDNFFYVYVSKTIRILCMLWQLCACFLCLQIRVKRFLRIGSRYRH